MKNESKAGYGFGTFQGVFTPSILTIIGVVMYLRFGWVLGSVGLARTLLIVTLSSAITFLTGLSVSALATNMKMGGGGAYYMISRSFGVEVGAAVGIPLFLSQAVSVAFYVAGFTEAFTHSIGFASGWDPRFVGLATLALLAAAATFSADWALKSQYAIMAAIGASLVSFFLGSAPEVAPAAQPLPEPPGFWHVLAIFFPAVTGILSGVGMSGDLKSPEKSLPRGTIAAVLTGWAVYMAVPIALDHFVADRAALVSDPMILQKCARIPWLILAGVWAASLSSALGGLLAAPRTLQALARDYAAPGFLGRGYGASNDPRMAAALGVALAGVGIWFGDIDALAPVLTIFNLTSYALLNLSSGLEDTLGSPSWRPSFRVHGALSFLGFAGCVGMMFMISPGATFIACACVAAIWWAMSRRRLRARWGDLRTGLLMSIAHQAVQDMERRGGDTHAWRPNMLVFSGAPDKRPRLQEFAAAVTSRHGLATYAAVIAESLPAERAAAIADAMKQHLERRGTVALVHVCRSESLWSGAREMVRTYGYGKLAPNTVLFGDADGVEFAKTLKLVNESRKNAVVLRSDTGELFPCADGRAARIDVWWRGRNSNASFMLALAYLLSKSASDCATSIRLCHLAESPESADAERERLNEFLAASRLAAETLVTVRDHDKGVFAKIAEISHDSSAVFIGLRQPASDESAEDYSRYIAKMRDDTASLPRAVFAFVSEEIDFKGFFNC